MASPRPKAQNTESQALMLAAEAIRSDFGDLDDFPVELKDTIANIYFKFFMLLFRELVTTRREEFTARPQAISEVITNLTATIEHLPEMVKPIREMRQSGNTALYDYSVDFLLDVHKYKIQNAGNKSAIRRNLERRFRKPDELNGLYQKMHELVLNSHEPPGFEPARFLRAPGLNRIEEGPRPAQKVLVRNTEHPEATQSKIGDHYVLTPGEAKAYHELVALGQKQWCMIMRAVAIKFGWMGALDPRTIAIVSNATSGAERRNLANLAVLLHHMQRQEHMIYFPRMRQGDYHFAFTSNAAANGPTVGEVQKVHSSSATAPQVLPRASLEQTSMSIDERWHVHRQYNPKVDAAAQALSELSDKNVEVFARLFVENPATDRIDDFTRQSIEVVQGKHFATSAALLEAWKGLVKQKNHDAADELRRVVAVIGIPDDIAHVVNKILAAFPGSEAPHNSASRKVEADASPNAESGLLSALRILLSALVRSDLVTNETKEDLRDELARVSQGHLQGIDIDYWTGLAQRLKIDVAPDDGGSLAQNWRLVLAKSLRRRAEKQPNLTADEREKNLVMARNLEVIHRHRMSKSEE